MAKGYWIGFYHSVSDDKALGEYAKLAGPAIANNGGKFLARGMPSKVFEAGVQQRTVLIEFDSFEQAVAARESAAYREALVALSDGVERDFRIVEGID